MQPVFGEMVSMTEEKYVQISRFTSISEEWRHLEDFSRQIDGLLADAIPDDNALVDIVMDVAHAIHPMVRSVATRIQEAARSGAIKNSDNVRFIAMEAHARTQSLYEAPSPEYQQEILSTIAADAIGDEDPPIHKLAAEIVLQELAHSRIQSSSQKPANQIDAMDAFRQICLVDPQTLWEALRNEPKAAALPAATVSFNAKRQWDVAAFENILRLHGNTEAEITKAIKLITEVPPESALLFEPAAGKAQAAYEIARLDPHCRVVVCDVFDGTYSGTTQMWKDGELLGQNEPLDNFVILKSPATLLDLLPDKSLDDFLLINPTLTLERGLGQFFQKDRIQRKMKPGGRVIFRPHASSDFWTRGEDIDGSFPDNIVFRTYSSVIRGVDLVRYSEHSEGQGAVLLWQSPLAAPKNRMGMVEFWNHPHLDWMPYGLKVFLSGILEPLWYQILLPLVNPSMMDPERRKAKFLNDHGPHQTAEQIGIRENLFVADRMASWISLVSLAAGSAIATPHSWLGWVSQIVMVVFIWSSPHLTWNVSEMFQPDPIYGFTGKPNAPPSAAAPKDLLGQFLAGTDANRSLDTYDALQTGDVVSLVELPDSGGERQTFIKELVELHRIHNGRIHQNLLPLAHRWRVNLAVVIAQAHNKAESQFLPIGQFSETLGDVQNPEAMAAESKVRTLSRLQFAKGDSFIVKLPAQQRKKGFNPTLLIYEKIRIKADQLAEALPGLRHLMLKNLPKWLLGTVISYGFGSYQIAYTVPVHANERFFQGHVMPVNLTAANNLIQHGHLKRASSSPAPKETGRNLTKTSS